MIRFASPLRLATLFALAALVFTAACTVPLAPGFHVQREHAESQLLSAAADSSPRLSVRVSYEIINSGNSPLSSINAILPNPATVARENLRVTFDGAEATVEPQPVDSAIAHSSAPFQINLAKPWAQGARISAEIAFDIPSSNGRSVLLAPEGLALDNYAWFPRLSAPPHRFLAKGDERAAITDVSLTVPRDFLALSSGALVGRKTSAAEIEYRFRLRGADPDPFLVAGHYHQQSAKASDLTVYFWTFASLPAPATESVGQQIASVAAYFDSTFGARAKKLRPVIWIVESPSPAAGSASTAAAPPSQSLPNVVLLSPAEIAKNFAKNKLDREALKLLAETWTRWSAFPRADERFLGPSLADYAVDSWLDSRDGGSGRRDRIAELLHAYDEKFAGVQQPSPAAKKRPPEARSAEKASLFLTALEDQCGAEHVRAGMAYSLTVLRGRDYSYDDLLAGIESQGCADLGRFFHEWLDVPGIPADFRKRYSVPAASSL